MIDKKKIVLILFILSFTLFFIGIGIYLEEVSRPKNIFSIGIHTLKNKFDNYFYNDFIEKYTLNNFDITSNINFDLTSEYYQNRIYDIEFQKKYNFINNLNKTKTDVTLKQNKKDNILYFGINQTLENEKLLNYKYYITNSTQYYSIENITSDYINNGNGNYFESLNTNDTIKQNIDYLYNFITESFINNLQDEYFKTSIKVTNINSKNIETSQISIRINNSLLRKILNAVIKDLKKDKKANKILSSIYNNFNDYQAYSDFKILDVKESYTINIYTTKTFHKPLKYEIIHLNGNDKKSYIYEGDDEKGTLYCIEKDKVINWSEYKDDGKTILFKIHSNDGKDYGEFKLEHENKTVNLDYNYNDGLKKREITYSSKNQGKYKNKKNISIKIIDNNESKLNGNISINTIIKKKIEISENIENAKLASKLTDDEKNKIDNLRNIVKERLER